jgi:hypothetical protein
LTFSSACSPCRRCHFWFAHPLAMQHRTCAVCDCPHSTTVGCFRERYVVVCVQLLAMFIPTRAYDFVRGVRNLVAYHVSDTTSFTDGGAHAHAARSHVASVDERRLPMWMSRCRTMPTCSE